MPITVTCRCGQRFAAPDSLQGQKVPCPICHSPIEIPLAGLHITCRCGMTSFAAESQRGQTTRCPGCGDLIRVPALLQEELPVAGPAALEEPLAPPIAAPSQTPWLLAGLVGGGCGLIGIVMILLALAALLLPMPRAAKHNAPKTPAGSSRP